MPQEGFFIIGNPRSGTSLLRSLLNVHPQVCVAPECGFLLWLRPAWADRTWDADAWSRFALEVLACRKFETWGISIAALERELLAVKPASFPEAARVVYAIYARARRKSNAIWGDKNNYYIGQVPEIRSVYPNARFIHIVRDVRDVACSYMELAHKAHGITYRPELPQDAEAIAREWTMNNQAALDALDGAAQAFIRYEDLVAAPAAAANALFRHLDLEPLLHLDASSHVSSLDEPQEFLHWKAKLTSPVDKVSVGRFRQELSAQDLGRIEAVAADLMDRFGYPKGN